MGCVRILIGAGICCDDVRVYNLISKILVLLVVKEGGLLLDDART